MFKGKKITPLIHEDGSIWFIAKECCEVLDHTNSRMATKLHCNHVKLLRGNISLHLGFNPHGVQIIPESDLYRLITNAQTPKAEPFKDWLYEQVLTTIHKTGSYSINPAASGIDNFKQAINAPFKLQQMVAIVLQELQNNNRIITAQGKAIQVIQPKAIALDRMCGQEDILPKKFG